MAQIQRIEIDQLFDLYDHRIDLHTKEHITILHGPNGIGKTALLRLLHGLMNKDLDVFRSIPFVEFRAYFPGDKWIRIKQVREVLIPSRLVTLTSSGTPVYGISIDVFFGKEKQKKSPSLAETTSYLETITSHFFPNIKRTQSGQWKDSNTKVTLSTAELADLLTSSSISDSLPQSLKNNLESAQLTGEFNDLLSDNSAYLIGTNRLSPPDKTERRDSRFLRAHSKGEDNTEDAPKSAVQHLANVIRNTIAATLSHYGSVSSERDRTFPERLVHEGKSRTSLTDMELRSRFANLDERRRQLQSVGLLDAQVGGRPFTVPDSLSETTLAVLSVYVEDTKAKLEVFDDVEARIALLKQIIDKRFLRTKKFVIDRQKGFKFVTKKSEISASQLSSGEQHELVLFCELLFTVPSGSCILIDEPELSLHVAWQLEFLADLQAVTRIRPMDIVIATHSPWIVNKRWDLTSEMGSDDSSIENQT